MSRKDEFVMLLAIKPAFASRIYDGSKNIELRRVKPSRDVVRVLIYETAPVKQITGWFTLRWIRSLSPSKTWSRYRRQLGVSRKVFRSYYQDCRTAILLAVSRVRKLIAGIHLSSVRTGLRAPQSFIYLNKRDTDAIR